MHVCIISLLTVKPSSSYLLAGSLAANALVLVGAPPPAQVASPPSAHLLRIRRDGGWTPSELQPVGLGASSQHKYTSLWAEKLLKERTLSFLPLLCASPTRSTSSTEEVAPHIPVPGSAPTPGARRQPCTRATNVDANRGGGGGGGPGNRGQ